MRNALPPIVIPAPALMEALEPRLLLAADVVISEIYYQSYTDQPAGVVPEDTGEEWIELYNRGDAPADMLGWKFTAGVNFEFPASTLGAGQYVVVPANAQVFVTKHPTVTNYITNAAGMWDGQLSNSGETIRLEDAAGNTVDAVTYADSGDWAVRLHTLDSVYSATYGYMTSLEWDSSADGGGKSLELINPAMTNNCGENWAASIPMGGTPGAPNSVASTNIAPLIRDVAQNPVIPRSTDPITVTATITDEQTTGLTVVLHHRADGASSFDTVTMYDDGLHGDGNANDGVYGGIIPAGQYGNGTIVEYYVEATDAQGNARSWPAPVVPVAPVTTGGHIANALFQVDDSYNPDATWTPGTPPEMRIIMTAADWTYLMYYSDLSDRSYKPDGAMNATLIVQDGTGTSIRYETDVRNRGNGSRSHIPHCLRVTLPSDNPWDGYSELNLNAQGPYSQAMGSAMFRYGGVAASDAVQVTVLTNGVNRALTGDDMYGYYAWLEPLDSTFAARHFPDDPNGNLYKCNYVITDSGTVYPDLTYLGQDPANYAVGYGMQTNKAADDYSGLIHMLDVINNAPAATYFQDVSQVINVQEWMRFMAENAFIGNQEGSLVTGEGDDYAMYQGTIDTRFQLVPYDLDTILTFGGSATLGIMGDYAGLPALSKMLNDPQIRQIYYQQMLDLIDTTFQPGVINPLIDQVLGGWRDDATRTALKAWVAARVAFVRAQIPNGGLTVTTTLPTVGGVPMTTTPMANFSGTASAALAQSITVNGRVAAWDSITGAWSYNGAGDYQETTLLPASSAVSYHVPALGEDLTSWTQVGFDDSSWTKANVVNGAGLLITEVGTGDTKLVEIENVSRSAINTAGWSVLVNNGSAGINSVNPTAWSLPASVAAGQVLYRTSDTGDDYWGAAIDWPATGSGWAMILNAAGAVQDFLPWGYTAAQIAAMSVSFGGFTGITAAGVWSGDGAAVGTTGGGTGGGWVAFNDEGHGAGTNANTTTYNVSGSTTSGLLKNVATGANTEATVTVTYAGCNILDNNAAAPAAGTDAYKTFNGYVDLASGTANCAQVKANSSGYYTYTFSGLDTGDAVTYNFAGTAIRGNSTYTNRWTLVTLVGADGFTPASSTGDGVITSAVNPALGANQVAIWTGDNSEVGQGFLAAWTNIDPGPDGVFAVESEQYQGITPGVGTGTATGAPYGYAISGVRLEEVRPSGPMSYIKRKGNTDGNTAADFARDAASSKGVQNSEMTVPFGTTTPTVQAVGFSAGEPSFDSLIATNVAAAMKNVNASIWTRYTFTGGDLTGLNKMTLEMRYDDGFVAYLNGVEVARRNAANPAAWNEAASGTRDDAQAVVFEDIDITALLGALTSGTNVLAIQGLNVAANDADFLLQAQLKVARGTAGVGLDFNPGMNTVVVKEFDAPYGTGNLLATQTTDVWYDNGTTHIYPQVAPAGGSTDDSQPLATLHVNLVTRDSYLPGIPTEVRVELLDANGNVYRDQWDATATLASDNPNVTLSASQVTLVNGLGTAMVTFTRGGSGNQNFDLTASVLGMTDTDDLTDLTGVAPTAVSGTLSGASVTWSGIVHVTGNVTVPTGTTLTIQPGTLILIDGVTSGTAGIDVNVLGNIQSLGTAGSPITWTAATAGTNWGEMIFNNAGPSQFTYTDITAGGASPGRGHTDTGPTISMAAGAITLTFDHANLTDEKGKVISQDGGTLDFTFRDSVMARAVTGAETTPTTMLVQDSWIVDMHNPDDADGIYIHGTTPQNVLLTGGVIAYTDDDGIDTLGPVITVQNMIIRDTLDKAISIYYGTVTANYCLFVDNGTKSEDGTTSSVSAKTDPGTPCTVNLDHTTIIRTPQAGLMDVGIEARWKYANQNPVVITYNVTNCIIEATRPVQNDYDDPTKANYIAGNTSVITFNDSYNDFFGSDAGWGRAGTGNINTDPLFVDPAGYDFHLQMASPSINAGDPNFAKDADGSTTDQGCFTDNAFTVVQGELTGNEVWGPANGQYRISGQLTVPAQYTLTILPGTTVFFDTGATLTVKGQLVADGAGGSPIWFTRTPGAGTWGGIRFQDSTPATGNIIRNAYLQYVDDDLGVVGQVNSELTIEDCTFDNAYRRRITTQNSSLIVRGCTFADTFPAGQQPFDGQSEDIWGTDAPAGGYLIIEDNTFGLTPGHNAAIDMDGGLRANGDPVLQILDNTFLGGGGDAMNLEGDAHIEGNLIENYHQDSYNLDPGGSNGISAGDAQNVGHLYVVVDNVFQNVDHAAQVKDNSTMTFANNTVSTCLAAALYFYSTGAAGHGHEVDVTNSIFWDTATIFGDAASGGTILTVNYSRVNAADVSRGTGNISDYPAFVDPAIDLHLSAGSPALGAGQYGTTMGGYVPAGAAIAGGPADMTYQTGATFTIGGNAIVGYKWRLNGGAWSAQQAPGTQVVLSGLAAGQQELDVIALDSAGVWQTDQQATRRTWTVNPALSQVLINEVLASNVAAYQHDAAYPDVVELYNNSAAASSLAGWTITDDPTNPRKYVLPAGTSIASGGYLLMYGGSKPTDGTGIYLGFALAADGEGVWLYDATGHLVDSIQFGMQITDLSLGRVGSDRHWALNKPTLGAANVAQATAPPLGLLINEWFANGDVALTDDFVELYNPNTLPVDLDGLYLTDNPVNQKTKYQFAQYNFVPASGFRAITADNSTASGHLDFALSANMEILGLFDANLQQMDHIYYSPQTTDVSQGRTPDGGSTIAFFALPTPNVANELLGGSTITTQTLVAKTAAKMVLVPTADIGNTWRTDLNFDTAGWTSVTGSPGGVGFDVGDPATYLPFISLNLGAQMNVASGSTTDRNTAYIRIPFTFSGNKADITALTLNVFNDDGYLVWLNGTLISSVRAPASPAWNSAATGVVSPEPTDFVSYDVSQYASALVTGQNLLAVQGLDATGNSSDFVFNAELVATTTVQNPSPMANMLAVQDGLRITEVMYHPQAKEGTEFIEFKNIGVKDLDLTGLRISGGVSFVFPSFTLPAGKYAVVVGNTSTFTKFYNDPTILIAGQYDPQRLSNSGQSIVLQMPAPYDAAILRFTYDDSWYPATDGVGASLVIRDPAAPRSAWETPDGWRPSSVSGGSPGKDDPVPEAPIDSVVVNEVLAHQDDVARVHEDWIELYNTTDQAIDISGWFLSDDPGQPQKFVIPGNPATPMAPGNTIIQPHGYQVFDEVHDFGVGSGNPGSRVGFALSELGDDVVVSGCDMAGNLGAYRAFASFGATVREQTVGRYVLPSGQVDFVAMIQPTYDAANSAPAVGPMVIDQIMYNPTGGQPEYVVLKNITDQTVPLYDPANPQDTWQFTEGILFTFPQGVNVPPGGYVVVSNVDEDTFRQTFALPPSVQVFGPFTGALSDTGETLTLAKPNDPQPDPPYFVPYPVADSVRYNDKEPWPTGADGNGPALIKLAPSAYGDDPSVWGLAPEPTITGAPPNSPQGTAVTLGSTVANAGSGLTYAWVVREDGQPFATADTQDITFTPDQGGVYVATLTVTDADDGFGAAAATITVIDTTPPTAAVVAVSPNPRNSAVGSMSIVFSEPVVGFDLADLSLTRGGGGNLLTGSQTLTTGDGGVTWTLGNLAGLTGTSGTYALSLTAAGSGIADLAGNLMAQNAGGTWLADMTPPVVSVDFLSTYDTTPPLSGHVDDPTATVRVTVNSVQYAAVNRGDGTWAVADNVIGPLAAGQYDVQVTATDPLGNVGSDTTTNELQILVPQVVGRYVFYNNSYWDGKNAAANAADDGAIAPDKHALLPGQTATFANYTNYSRGINGIMIDVSNLPPGITPTAADFEFRVGNSNTPTSWALLPTADAPTITIRRGAGAGGSDRITLIFPDGTAAGQWLRVKVLSGGDIGLAGSDVFYFGNAIGEVGDSPTDAKVTVLDVSGTRANQTTFLNPPSITDPYDFNRDHAVNTVDVSLVRSNQTTFLNALKIITVPAESPLGLDPLEAGEDGSLLASLPIVPLGDGLGTELLTDDGVTDATAGGTDQASAASTADEQKPPANAPEPTISFVEPTTVAPATTARSTSTARPSETMDALASMVAMTPASKLGALLGTALMDALAATRLTDPALPNDLGGSGLQSGIWPSGYINVAPKACLVGNS